MWVWPSPARYAIVSRMDDKSFYRGQLPPKTAEFRQDPNFPFWLGHESGGTVVEVGAKINDYKVGDKVIAFGWCNNFADYFVAEAAVSLKQGAGRLIRHEDDRGLLVIADVRMRQMGYGKRLLRALPPMTPIADEAEAMAWLDELAAAHDV